MSYILEALKKAQAERQLGNAPTIHAPVVHAVPAARASRMPFALGAVAAVVLIGAALFAWRQSAPAAPAAVLVKAAPAPVAAVPPPVSTVAPASSPQVALLPEPVAPPVRKSEPPVRKPEAPARQVAKAEPVRPAAVTPDPVPAAPARAAGAEETVRGFSDLPEAVRREVPKVVFGGYIYSPNPADRLLLVDKMLRREGEEVAPGLVLERLLPNAAVMNYRGQRYRVPY
ncbi:MAG TPA: general secretion pathway protein GspB [Telluria sp.]|nr:general secretion pathway protein GspB [Telluria sp.]